MKLMLTDYIILIIGIITLFLFIYFSVISYNENEKQASIKLAIIGILAFLLFLTVDIYSFQYKNLISISIIIFVAITFIILLFPYQKKNNLNSRIPKKQIDERDIMFSRYNLIEHTNKYNNYYSENPELKDFDDYLRNKPGLLSEKSALYNQHIFSATEATFTVSQHLKSIVQGIPRERKTVNIIETTNFIKNWVTHLGAVSVGITELKEYHLYSHHGRKFHGEKIVNNDKYAIAFTVEMDKDLIDSSPNAPTILESSKKYVDAAVIAVQLAKYIRNLGFNASAHIDESYEVVCPLVARDAGLGEIGRMGLLMTPELGPRVRIAVVTTEIELITDSINEQPSIINFCTICKKCAESCPSNAISFNKQENIDGTIRWQINQEKCFEFWVNIGTDCGKCVSVCPYSHPNNLMHNIIRSGIRNSSIFSILALKMDDYFYGRKPKTKISEKLGL